MDRHILTWVGYNSGKGTVNKINQNTLS